MSTPSTAEPGQVVGGRYRLERRLGQTEDQGPLWLARDLLAAETPVALRRVPPQRDQARARDLWARLQGVLHPQVPRIGAAISEGDDLWLVRDWQAGRTYAELLDARRERQLVFGAGEVLLLLRQLLPVLAALHSQDLLHGDLSPANLLRRDSDGLPVLLDFGLVRGSDGAGPLGATPGYAPPELSRGEPAQPWMDLHALGVVALVLLSGDEPAALLDPVSLDWRWPTGLEDEPALRERIQRLLSSDPSRRFASAGQALVAFQQLEMPESTGPVPRADRTVMLVPPAPAEQPAEQPGPGPVPEPVAEASPEPVPPPAVEPESAPEAPAAPAPPAPATAAPAPVEPPMLRPRYLEKEEAAEGGLWPVLIALVLSAIAGTALGWWWLGRGRPPEPGPQTATELPSSLPPAEVDQRQQLLNRLRAMQIDRAWFLRLVDASLLAQYPERRGRLPSDALEDAPLRKVWNDLAEEWLARVEQLPLSLRQRLGSFSSADWDRRRQALEGQGLSSEVLRQLVSDSASNLLPGRLEDSMPEEPFRQLWYAAADQILANVRIESINVPSRTNQLVSADVPASGARLFAIRLPAGHALALGVNGTPLLQMSVFAADGSALEAKGPLRVVSLGPQKASPVQLLVANEGVAPARISLSLRADPPAPPAVPPPPEPGEPPAPPPEGATTPSPAPNADATPAPAGEPTPPASAPEAPNPPSTTP
ncbi:phosphotransferase [Cyanobium sp. FGCU-52]|nr:phosphotransferase [Cyanobium sp. FGCU52]